MSNDQAYADGLLTRALDRASQPPAIRDFLREENARIQEIITDGMSVVDLGCGTGRHLLSIGARLSLGLGVDYEPSYLQAAARGAVSEPVYFVAADASAVPTTATFDLALCTTNTWGTMADKRGVLNEMCRLAPRPRSRLLTVYAAASVEVRCEWYARLGLHIAEVTEQHILTLEGFCSGHFTESRIRGLAGECAIEPLTEIAYLVSV